MARVTCSDSGSGWGVEVCLFCCDAPAGGTGRRGESGLSGGLDGEGPAHRSVSSRGPLISLLVVSHWPLASLPWVRKSRLRCSVHPPFASLPRRSPRGVVGPWPMGPKRFRNGSQRTFRLSPRRDRRASASSSRRWNCNSAGAGLVHAFDSRRAVCELLASHNTQILACFPDPLD